MLLLYEEEEQSDASIRSDSLNNIRYDSVGGHGSDHKDLTDIVLKHQALKRQRSKEIRTEMWRLVEEEATIRRVWTCYNALEVDTHRLIHALYVEKRPYKDVLCQMTKNQNMSKSKFERIRKEAIEEVIHLYLSDRSNIQIIGATLSKKGKEKKKPKSKKEQFEQIKLNI